MYIGRLRSRMPRWFSSKGSVTAKRRRIQVWGVNREVRTGVERLESKGVENLDSNGRVESIHIAEIGSPYRGCLILHKGMLV
jgi:hypothetical protein